MESFSNYVVPDRSALRRTPVAMVTPRLPLQAAVLLSVAAHVLGMMWLSAAKLAAPGSAPRSAIFSQHPALKISLVQRQLVAPSVPQIPVTSPRITPLHIRPLPTEHLQVTETSALRSSGSATDRSASVSQQRQPEIETIPALHADAALAPVTPPAPLLSSENSGPRHAFWPVSNAAPVIDQQALYQAHLHQQAMRFMLADIQGRISRYQAQLSGLLKEVKLSAACQMTVQTGSWLQLRCDEEQDSDVLKTAIAKAGAYPVMQGSMDLIIHFTPQSEGGVAVAVMRQADLAQSL